MLLYSMNFSMSLRTAAVTLAFFSAAIAGNAQTVSKENVNKLLNASTVEQVQSLSVAEVSKKILRSSMDKETATMLSPKLKMEPIRASVAMMVVTNSLKLHLEPKQQQVALESILLASTGQLKAGDELLATLPEKNVAVQAIQRVYANEKLFDTPVSLESITLEMRKMPSFNVQRMLEEEGVKTLQSILENPCSNVQTSLSLVEVNKTCAMKQTGKSEIVTNILKNRDVADGILVGEYEGYPVFVANDPDTALGAAAIFQIDPSTKDSVMIIIASKVLNGLKDSPDAIRLLIEHELGHVAHNHTVNGLIQNELEADSFAMKKRIDAGMSLEDANKAWTVLHERLGSLSPPGVSDNPEFVKMMTARANNIADIVKPSTKSFFASLSW